MTFRIGDALVYLFILLLVIGSFVGLYQMGRGTQERQVVVEVDGVRWGTYDLPTGNDTKEILIDAGDGRFNRMVLTGTGVSIQEANCPDQICVTWGKISKAGQTIVCLPHKVVISIIGGREGEPPLDDIAS